MAKTKGDSSSSTGMTDGGGEHDAERWPPQLARTRHRRANAEADAQKGI
jgi:hypothetical protein